VVKTIEHDPKVVEHWMDSITALHRTQPPPNVHYSRCSIHVDSDRGILPHHLLSIRL